MDYRIKLTDDEANISQAESLEIRELGSIHFIKFPSSTFDEFSTNDIL